MSRIQSAVSQLLILREELARKGVAIQLAKVSNDIYDVLEILIEVLNEEKAALTSTAPKVVQICANLDNEVYALSEDGTVWEYWPYLRQWKKLPTVKELTETTQTIVQEEIKNG